MTITVDNDSTDEYNYWFKHGYAVADPAPSATLDMTAGVDWSIDVSGTLTQTQYTGEQVDLTGLSFRADYVNGCYKGISIDPNMGEVSPRIWDDSGNPNNLGEQTATLSKTMDGVTKTATVTTVIHRPDDQTISASTGGHLYYDLTQELFNHATQDNMAGPMDILTGQATPSTGDWVNLVFTQDEIDDPSLTVNGTKMQGWAQQVLIQPDQSSPSVALPNTPQFEPGFGFFTNGDLNSSYYAVALQGGAQLSEPVTLYSVFGTLKTTGIDPSVGYCLSDLNVADRTTYIARITV